MKKWITYPIGILLTLVVLAAVGGAGYRMGLMQGCSGAYSPKGGPTEFAKPGDADQDPNQMGQNSPDNIGPGHDDGHRFEHGRGEMHFFSPLFGLMHLVVIGLLIWLAYTLYKKSGWQFVRVNAPSEPGTPGDEKKLKRKSKS